VALRLAQALEAAPGRSAVSVQEVRLSSQWWTYRNTKAKRELGFRTAPHEDAIEATVAWYMDREGDRIQRSRRSQPVQYKVAAATLGALGNAGDIARRLWPLAA
jgi:dihydroflavonol-4-reductase